MITCANKEYQGAVKVAHPALKKKSLQFTHPGVIPFTLLSAQLLWNGQGGSLSLPFLW